MYSENITQQTICRVISQQMLYFSQHFVEKFCLENASCDVYGHLLSFDGHDFFESSCRQNGGILGNFAISDFGRFFKMFIKRNSKQSSVIKRFVADLFYS